MNIIRRLFGKREESSESRLEEVVPEVELVEEAAPPQSISIPGVKAEIDLAQPPVPADELAGYGVTRQLPTLESALNGPNQHITFGHSTDVGMMRANNQDAVLAFFASQSNAHNRPDFGMFIVADGMGGHHDGEKASAVATQVFAEQVTRHIFLPLLDQEHGDPEALPITEILNKAVKTSNDVVVSTVPEGGTTITAVTVVGDLAYLVHVGDSRAYLITKEYGIEQITRDHSLVQRLIELDQLTQEEASHHPQKNVLYRAIGQSDHLEVDTITRRLPAQSYVLLCSDGLWNMVPEEVMLDIIASTEAPQEACDQLIAIANEHGGTDNISAILLQIPG